MIPFAVPEIKLADTWSALRAPRPNAVADLEEAITKIVGTRYAIAMGSARQAMTHLYRYALGRNDAGSRILASPYTCVPAVDAVRWAGGDPVFCDIDDHYNLAFDPRIEELSGVCAVGLSYLYGCVANNSELISWARSRDAFVVEDAAIALGACVDGRPVGSLGDAGVFSLQSSKIVGAFRGAVVTTDHPEVDAFLRAVRSELPATSKSSVAFNTALMAARRVCGTSGRYGWTFAPLRRLSLSPIVAAPLKLLLQQDPSEAHCGRSALEMPASEGHRLSAGQAELALRGLERLPEILARRRTIAAAYREALQEIVVIPPTDSRLEPAYGRFPLRVPGVDKASLLTTLARRGVEAGDYYPYTITETMHCQKAEVVGDLSNAKRAARETTLLPMHTALTDADVGTVIDAVAHAVSVAQRSHADTAARGRHAVTN